MSWIRGPRDVSLASVLLIATVFSAQPQEQAAGRAHSVHGVVIDATGTPVPQAEVQLMVGGMRSDAARTGDNGLFAVSTDSSGPATLRVRRLGYEPKDVELSFPADDHRQFTITVAEAASRLAEVRIDERADEARGYLREFYERSRTNSFGHYYNRDVIMNAHARRMSELLRTTPGVRLMESRGGSNVVRVRGCFVGPMIWVDGMRVPDAELDEVARPDDIAAMEVYTSPAGVPAQYMDRSNSGCGTIVVWTRHE